MKTSTSRFEEDVQEYLEEHDLDGKYQVMVDLEPEYGEKTVTVHARMWAVNREPWEKHYDLGPIEDAEAEELFSVWENDVKDDNKDIDWL